MASYVGLVAFLLVCCIACLNARWCTRSRSSQMVEEITEMHECNKTYHARCGYFFGTMCTYHETVPCAVKKNITLTRYYIVEECCPGYKLDPINNQTCIHISGTAYVPQSPDWNSRRRTARPITRQPNPPDYGDVTKPTSGSKWDNSQSSDGPSDVKGNGEDSFMPVGSSDDLLFGLSYGAYAGIISAMLFLICITILILVRLRKKSRRSKAKGTLSTTVEMETTQKMLTTPA